MTPYLKLLSLVGFAAFWLSFSSLWAERSAQRLELPLNIFKSWAEKADDGTPQRAAGVTMIAILVCWPFTLATLYLLWRCAQKTARTRPRWERLPAPFELEQGLSIWEQNTYRLFFLLLFWVVPMIQAAHFAVRFFFKSPPRKLFHWSWDSWFGSMSGADRLYGGLSYFSWLPILILLALACMTALNALWLREVFRQTRQ